MTGRRKKEKRGLTGSRATGPAPSIAQRAPAPPAVGPFAVAGRRWAWSLVLLLAAGGAALVLQRELRASGPRPVAPPDLSLLDPAVRRLVEEHLRAAEEEPSAQNHGMLGLVYEANGLWSEAERSFALAGELAPEQAPWPLHRGIARANLGDFEAARGDFRLALLHDGESAAAHHRLADVLLSSGEVEQALPHLEAAVRLRPERPEGHAGLGTAHHRRGEFELARVHLARAVELDPSYRSAHYQLGLTYRELGRAEEAERELALGLDAQKRFLPDALDERVRSFQAGYSSIRGVAKNMLESGRTQEGIAVLEELREQRSKDTYVLNDLAVAYLGRGDSERAHELLLEAKAIDEREFMTWINLAAWGLKTFELDQALAYAERAVELAGPVATAHLVRGNVLAKKGRYAEAQASLQEAVRLDPRNADAHHALARASTRLRRYEEARASLIATTGLDPERWEAYLDLSQLNVRLGDLTAARKALEKAQRIAPQHQLVVGMAREIERREAGAR